MEDRKFINCGRVGHAILIADQASHFVCAMYSERYNPHVLEDTKLILGSRDLLKQLIQAERFMRGFEGDELQHGVDERLVQIREAIFAAGGEPA